MTEVERQQYVSMFKSLGGYPVGRAAAAPTFERAQISSDELDLIWSLCDLDADGCLDELEFCLALHLAARRFMGAVLPDELPEDLVPESKRGGLQETEGDDETGTRAGKERRSRFGKVGGMVGRRGGSASTEPKEPRPSKNPFGRSSKAAAAPPVPPPLPQPQPEPEPGLTPFQAIQMAEAAKAAKAASGAEEPPPAQVEPRQVQRSGQLILGKKSKWCVLSDGHFCVFDKKADADGKKPPKHAVELAKCPKVACSDIKSFTMVLPSAPPKGGKAAKPGETLIFSAEDSGELIGWANDLTMVWRALAAHAR